MTEAQQIEALRAALWGLVKLHRNWDCGTAYVRREFVTLNDKLIADARVALAANETFIQELHRIGSIRQGAAILDVTDKGYRMRSSDRIVAADQNIISLDSSPERVEAHWNGFLANIGQGK